MQLPVVQVRLLGQFELRVDGATRPALESARAESLLAYLLLHRDAPQSRQRLAYALWPDSTDVQARTNLRHVLHILRRLLPDPERFLEITPRTLRWRPDVGYELDVDTLERALAEAANHGGDDPEAVRRRIEALRTAATTYRGELLEGSYDEWLSGERERLRHRHLDALAELAELCAAHGERGEAVAHAERLLRADPLREPTYRLLMALYAARGDRAKAIRVFHVCSSTLERELGVQPSAQTKAAYDALLPREPDVPAPVPSRSAGPRLVGRAVQQARLAAAWRSAETGEARLVLVTGEPGVGKTRLVEDFQAWCARRGAAVAEARCYLAEGLLAYGPVVGWLRSDALRPRLAGTDPARLTELARLLPELLAERADLPPPGPLPESEERHRVFDAVASVVHAGSSPVLLVVDDLQWGDRQTCRLLHYLIRTKPSARLLVVATARREEVDAGHPIAELTAGLAGREALAEIELARLDLAETAVLAERLAGTPLPEPDAERLHAETEGNPLFVVEAIRAGWTAGRALSPRVQAVIEARLAHLTPPARELAEVAATIGRQFSADVLADVLGAGGDPAAEDALVRNMDELWRRRIVREQGSSPNEDSYDFSHDKIREVAYLGVGPARRRRLHVRIAQALERRDADGRLSVAAQIGGHYERAGQAEHAVRWYRRAADRAALRHADAQAVELLDRALVLLLGLPPTRERDATELQLRTALLGPLVTSASYASPLMSATHERALELAARLDVDPAPPLLRSLALSSLTRGKLEEATRFGELLQAAAHDRGGPDRDADSVAVVEAAYVLGIAAFWQADFETARRQFELAVARYRPEDRDVHLMRYAQDPKVVCLGRLACTLWFLRDPEAAVAASAAGLAWAEEIQHPYTRTVALTFACLLALEMGDEAAIREYAAELVGASLGAANQYVPGGFAGYVAVLDGDTDRGLAAVKWAADQIGKRPAAPGQYAVAVRVLLAAHLAAGNAAAAVETAERLLAMGGGAQVWAPEARRVCADLATADG